MREVKFRAWYKGEPYPLDENDLQDYEKPRMIYDVQNAYDGSGFKDEFNALGWISNFSDFMDDERFILMQYTGLKDKNGKEIYDGDIIEAYIFDADNTEKTIGKVEYNNERHGFVFIPNLLQSKNIWYPLFAVITCNVIGNIYENLELLEGATE